MLRWMLEVAIRTLQHKIELTSSILTSPVHSMHPWPVAESAPSSRIVRRRALQRERIVAVAARRFAEVGPDLVRLDQIADAADLARGTLYSHFPTKGDLIRAIVRPVLEHAVAGLRRVARGRARDRIEGLLALYLELWGAHRDALRVSYRLQHVELGEIAALHGAFLEGVLTVLGAAAKARILRTRDPIVGARMIMRTAVPLLEICTAQPNGEQLFIESMRGLLIVDRRK